MSVIEKAAALIGLQDRCARSAGRIIQGGTVRAYCSPRWAPDHVHLTVNEDKVTDPDGDPLAYWDSDDGGDDIPGSGAILAEMREILPGASVSIVVFC